MPPDSSWKTPTVLASLSRAKVLASSKPTFSILNLGSLRCFRTSFWASSTTVSVFSPKKSIFSRPNFSTGSLAYWVVRSPSCIVTGMMSVSGRSAMIIPHACLPLLRTMPSITRPVSIMLAAVGLLLTSARSSLDFFSASSSEMLMSSGTSFARRLVSMNGRSRMRAKSRTTILAPNVPKVMMLATRSAPYFCRT